ncbi:terminase small subunit [Bacteroides sp.]|uniref:terminase small subunit n=1 Tax=Bacteroides sp. TaxID=29523 RepID=UPI002608353F|nr:terminase small subunit [Bacteroides sp.]
MRKKVDKPLTLKQDNFCQYYVDTDGNASEAYRMAYDASKMKPETIWSAASRLIADSKVSARINEIREQRAKESEVKREVVEKVLMDIIMADPSDLFIYDHVKDKVVIKAPGQLPKKLRNALKKISNKRSGVTYEFNGKTEAARLLGAWNGWDAPKKIDLTNGMAKVGELRIGFDDEKETEK